MEREGLASHHGAGWVHRAIKGQLPRQVLEAEDLALEELPLEALDVELQDVHGVVAEQLHRLRKLFELHCARLASEVAVAGVEAGALLANAPIMEGEGLASHPH